MENIKSLKRLRYVDSKNNIGRNTSAVIYIPESILSKRNATGLTLYLNIFYICKDLLNFRNNEEHKITISANANESRIGDKPYIKDYIKCEIIVPKEELDKISELIKTSKEVLK